MSTVPVGVFIATSTPPEQIPALAKRVESLGYSELWVAEDYFCYGGMTAAALALGATTTIKVGLGVVASVARHPAVTAMEIATLARVYPDRFLPGIGHGLGFWTDQMGLTPTSPLTALTEAVTGIRHLLSGETLDNAGKQFTFNSVALTHPAPADVPILTGVLGPKSLKLSGKLADGTVMSVLAGTKYLEDALVHIQAGMAEGGRTSHLIPTFALFSCKPDLKAAKQAARPMLAFYLAAVGPHNALTKPYGYNEVLADMNERGAAELIEREMTDEWVDELTVSGDPDEVADRIKALQAAGATSVVLSPVNVATAAEELELVAKSVFPKLG